MWIPRAFVNGCAASASDSRSSVRRAAARFKRGAGVESGMSAVVAPGPCGRSFPALGRVGASPPRLAEGASRPKTKLFAPITITSPGASFRSRTSAPLTNVPFELPASAMIAPSP